MEARIEERRASQRRVPGWVGGVLFVALLAAVVGGLLFAASRMQRDGKDSAEAGAYQAGLLVDRVGALRDPAVAPSAMDAQAWPFGRTNVVIEAQAPAPGAKGGTIDVAVGKVPRSACAAIGGLVGPGQAVVAASVNGTGFFSGRSYMADKCLPDLRSKKFNARNVVVLRVERVAAE